MLLDFPWIDWAALGIETWSDHVRTLIHVGEKESGADAGAGVQSRAAISVAASTDLTVEKAVHPILFRAKDGCQVLGHRPKPKPRP